MKSQKPAEGISASGDWGDTKTYTIHCECGQQHDAHDIMIESDGISVSVFIYHTKKSKWYEVNRWKQIWQLLTRGYLETHSELVMNEQVAINYAETLKAAMKDVKKLREGTTK